MDVSSSAIKLGSRGGGVAHSDERKVHRAGRALHGDHVARAFLEQRAAERRAPTDAPFAWFDLVFADDAVFAARPVFVFDSDPSAEEHDVTVVHLGNDARSFQPFGEKSDPTIDLAQAFFAVDVARVLGAITL